MIEADNVESFFAGVLLAAHQLLGANQEPISFRFLFTGIGDWINLKDLLAAVVESAEHQAAALIRVIALSMRAHRTELIFANTNHALDPETAASGAATVSNA